MEKEICGFMILTEMKDRYVSVGGVHEVLKMLQEEYPKACFWVRKESEVDYWIDLMKLEFIGELKTVNTRNHVAHYYECAAIGKKM